MGQRLGIVYCSVELIARLMPPGTTVQWLDSELGTVKAFGEGYEKLHKALKLPANCRITGVSPHVRFANNEIVLRVESPEFVETPEGGTIPTVEAYYNEKGFDRWIGLGVMNERLLERHEFDSVLPARQVNFREFL